ncbi:MAG TPA: hypothetical protein PK435_14355, partial [Thermoanaerobaculaceae bacterium]|nr:hypothetical protein [Thermoanaerobaculaceae bacterium]
RTFNPEVVRGRAGIERMNPPVVRREIVQRGNVTRQGGPPVAVRPAPPTFERYTAPRSVERVSPPPPRPRNNSVSWVRERNTTRWEGGSAVTSQPWAAATSRDHVTGARVTNSYEVPRGEVRSYTAPRGEVRSYAPPRSEVRSYAPPRSEVRSYAPPQFHSAPARAAAPRAGAGRPHR